MNIEIEKFEQCNILVVGDLMIDKYLWGSVDRISPEAPVQIVLVNNENFTLGGAGNVINNLVSLGAKVIAAGVTGADDNGRLLLQKLDELGVDPEGVITDSDRPTTVKTRIIATNQHVLRVDRETDKEVSIKTRKAITDFIEKKIPHVDLVLISDYGKGLITDDLMSRLVVSAKKHGKITIADPKGSDFSKYSGVSLITPNKKEASQVSGISITDDHTLYRAGAKILKSVSTEKLLITCGKEGMVLFERERNPYKISAKSRQVFDVSGAGDTVLAVLGLAKAIGIPFKDGVFIANAAAGIVVSKVGTATVTRKELLSALREA